MAQSTGALFAWTPAHGQPGQRKANSAIRKACETAYDRKGTPAVVREYLLAVSESARALYVREDEPSESKSESKATSKASKSKASKSKSKATGGRGHRADCACGWCATARTNSERKAAEPEPEPEPEPATVTCKPCGKTFGADKVDAHIGSPAHIRAVNAYATPR